MSNEEWRPIPGWEGLYSVSSLGRVRSEARITMRSNGFRYTVRARIVKAAISGGRQAISMRDHGTRVTAFVHRLVALAFIGPVLEGMEVCHGDGDPLNNRPDNLRYATHAENMADMVLHGRTNRGVPGSSWKLGPASVRAIRALAGDVTAAEIGRQFGVSISTVSSVVSRKTWGWVQ